MTIGMFRFPDPVKANCYAFFASSLRRLCSVSSFLCSGCALYALTVQMLFWLWCAGSWHTGFGQSIDPVVGKAT